MAKTQKTGTEAAASREDRLGAALRANLARRKAQARARAEVEEGEQELPKRAPESEE